MAPLVSVVIPAYNAAATLRATVESALKQTVTDIEIIIVDDGSADETFAVGKSIQDSRVRILSQANGGAAAARNTAIREATGKYVALLDADDLWLPHKLQRQLDVLENRLDVLAVQSGAIFVNNALDVLSVRPCTPSRDVLLETLVFQNLPAYLSTLVVARKMFDEMGYFDPSLEILEEWDMAIKCARYCNMASIEEPLCLYRIHPGNRSRNLDIHIRPGYLVLDRLFADPTIPNHIRAQQSFVYARFFTMLAGGALHRRRWVDFLKWSGKAVLTHPASLTYMAGLPLRKLRRFRSKWHPGTIFNTPVTT